MEHLKWDFYNAIAKPLATKLQGVNPKDINTLDKLYDMAQNFKTAYLYDTKKTNPTAWSELYKTIGEKRWGGRRRQGQKGNN